MSVSSVTTRTRERKLRAYQKKHPRAASKPSLRQRLMILQENAVRSTTALFVLLAQLGGEYLVTEATVNQVNHDFRFLRSEVVENPHTYGPTGERNPPTFAIRLLHVEKGTQNASEEESPEVTSVTY